MTPQALRRLLADLPATEPPHPIDAGLLGEYAFARREHGQSIVGERYPRVAAHLRTGCQRCEDDLIAFRALVRRLDAPVNSVEEPSSDAAAIPAAGPISRAAIPEPLEIAEAIALGRAIEAERESLRAPLAPDRPGQVDPRRQATRRRALLLVEAALVRQRLIARRLFLDRAYALLAPRTPSLPSSSEEEGREGVRAPALLAGRSGPGSVRGPGGGGRLPNPKAHLLLDEFAAGVDDLARLTSRVGRLTVDIRRLGDDPRGPARSQSEAFTNRGLSMTREALSVDHRLARLQGILAGMVT